jgi:hypothetical protein
MFKFLGGLNFWLRKKHAAIIGLVVDEVDHVSIAIAVSRRDRPFQIGANNSANAIDWCVVPRVLL